MLWTIEADPPGVITPNPDMSGFNCPSGSQVVTLDVDPAAMPGVVKLHITGQGPGENMCNASAVVTILPPECETAEDCDDDNLCNGLETCDAEDGCQPGTPLVCDDGDPSGRLITVPRLPTPNHGPTTSYAQVGQNQNIFRKSI